MHFSVGIDAHTEKLSENCACGKDLMLRKLLIIQQKAYWRQ